MVIPQHIGMVIYEIIKPVCDNLLSVGLVLLMFWVLSTEKKVLLFVTSATTNLYLDKF